MEINESQMWREVIRLRNRSRVAFSSLQATRTLRSDHGVCAGASIAGAVVIFFVVLAGSFAGATTISIPNIGTFEAPDGFTSLSQEEIKVQFPRGHPPAFAIGNEKRTRTISYEIRAMSVPADKLREVKSTVETSMAQSLPGLKWKKTDIVNVQGRSWLYFEHVTPGRDFDTHNIFLWIPLAEQSLFMNFSCPKDDFPKIEPVFRQSIRSISISAP